MNKTVQNSMGLFWQGKDQWNIQDFAGYFEQERSMLDLQLQAAG